MKKKTCRICKDKFTPFQTTAIVCSPKCALVHINNQKLLARKKDTRERKKALKTKSDWLKEAQSAFNAYIRERDKHENCISCQRLPKKRNAGHWKSVGAYPELRFHPFNCNLQCEHCNTYKSGNQVEYRANLVNKVGVYNVEWLEGPHKVQNLTIEDIKEIKQWYKDQLKYLKG